MLKSLYRWGLRMLVLLLLLLAGPAYLLLSGAASVSGDWRSASHAPIGIAPDPQTTNEAVVQVYAARAFAWRGAFAVHTWVAVKPQGAARFTSFEVVGWNLWHGRNIVEITQGPPDREWYGARPDILVDLRGEEAAQLIPKIEAAVAAYPFAQTYRTWPGPNSNTFTAWIARQVPGLGLDLPATAIGKDYLGWGQVYAPAPSGTGIQLSLGGLIGVILAREEGLELNLLGLAFGLDPLDLALRWPGFGRIAPFSGQALP